MNKISNLINYLKNSGFKKEAAFLIKISQDGQNRIHTIRSGDNPDALAREFGVAREDIMRLNGLKLVQKKDEDGNVVLNRNGNPILIVDPHLVPGESLIIPPAQVLFNSAQKYSDSLVSWMKVEEGGVGGIPYNGWSCELGTPGRGEPYLCSYYDGGSDEKGYLTIGWGRRQDYQTHQTTTIEKAEEYLRQDLDAAKLGLIESIEGVDETKLQIPFALNQHQFDALTSLIFNAGRGGFKDSSLYRDFISQGKIGERYASQIRAAFVAIRRAKGQSGLISRRNREADMFLNGQYKEKP